MPISIHRNLDGTVAHLILYVCQRRAIPDEQAATNSEKLETQRYLLTASNLSVTVHREQRTVPLQMLDLDATLAANRDRGIDLRIPNERNEISLRF